MAGPLYELAGGDLNDYMKRIIQSPEDILSELCLARMEDLVEMIWDVRRVRNVEICKLDDSGRAKGWTSSARLMMISVSIRQNHFVYLSERFGAEHVRKRWSAACMTHALFPVSRYNLRDIQLALRTASRMWTADTFWKHGPEDTVRMVEILLHDINLRLEEIIYNEPADYVLPSEIINETCLTIAHIHCILRRFQNEIKCKSCDIKEAFFVPEYDNIRRHITELRMTWEDYNNGYKKLKEEIQNEFLVISRADAMSSEIKLMLKEVLLPINIYCRYKAMEKLENTSLRVASEKIFSIAELQWLDNDLGNLKPKQYLDPGAMRFNQKHLFELCTILKISQILFSQYNVNFSWIQTCVCLDRDISCMNEDVWKSFTYYHPCIITLGTNVYVVQQGGAVRVRDIYDAIFLWTLLIRKENGYVHLSVRDSLCIKREVDALYNKCL